VQRSELLLIVRHIPSALIALEMLLGASCRSEAPRGASTVAPPPGPSLPPPASAQLGTVVTPGASSTTGLSLSLITPNPIVSRGKPAFGFSPMAYARPSAINDGAYRSHGGTWMAGTPTPTTPLWVAIDVGRGPTRLLAAWSSNANTNYNETTYGAPGAYRIDVSADSTSGADGAWKTVATVTDNHVRVRAHSFDFTGQRWVKLVVTAAPSSSPNGVAIDELDVHDISAGVSDTWFFFGDSITAAAFDRQTPEHQPSFAEVIHKKHPRAFPAMINGGIGGEWSEGGLKRLDECLALNPDAHFWAIGYGTNDASGNRDDPSRFASNLRTLVGRLKEARRVPIIARIPFATDQQHNKIPLFNAVVDQVTRENHLVPGPDLYAWFQAHPDALLDGIHPHDRGTVSMNRLWADAVDRLYGP
jgi:acyl-CoA thioesterase-1